MTDLHQKALAELLGAGLAIVASNYPVGAQLASVRTRTITRESRYV